MAIHIIPLSVKENGKRWEEGKAGEKRQKKRHKMR